MPSRPAPYATNGPVVVARLAVARLAMAHFTVVHLAVVHRLGGGSRRCRRWHGSVRSAVLIVADVLQRLLPGWRFVAGRGRVGLRGTRGSRRRFGFVRHSVRKGEQVKKNSGPLPARCLG